MPNFCKLLVVIIFFTPVFVHAQDSLPAKKMQRYAEDAENKAVTLSAKLEAKNAAYIKRLARLEKKLRKKLWATDSTLAKAYDASLTKDYAGIDQLLANSTESLKSYSPAIDTLRSSLLFLGQNNMVKGVNTENALGAVKKLETDLQKSDYVETFIRERTNSIKSVLNTQLNNNAFSKELKAINKTGHYYTAQLKEYREVLKDKKKREEKALSLLRESGLYKDFMRRNSWFSALFPNAGNSNMTAANIPAGMQTRAQVSSFIQQQLPNLSNSMREQLQQNVQSAQQSLGNLQNRLSEQKHFGDMDLPDFKPNDQKVKPFLKRLVYGLNIQSQGGTRFLPATTDIGGSLGYKLNDRSIIGVGVAYKIGIAHRSGKFNITQQGLGLRSFVDWQIKGGFWISGGYEQNHRPDLGQLGVPGLNTWQKSGLIGLSKQIPFQSTFFKHTKVQLLWDFLSYSQTPRSQPVLFRVGYGF